GTDRIVDPLDLEPGCKGGGRRRAHGLGHGEGPDALRALFLGNCGRFDDDPGRWAAGPHDDPGAFVRNLIWLEPRILDRLIHRNMVPCGAAAMESHRPTIDQRFDVNVRRAMHLAAEADFGIFLCPDDSGTAFAQRRKHFLDIVPDGGHDPHSGYRYSSHANSFPPSGGILPEQAYPQIACLVYGFSVSLQPSVADPQHQPAPHDALEIDAIFD